MVVVVVVVRISEILIFGKALAMIPLFAPTVFSRIGEICGQAKRTNEDSSVDTT